MTVPAPLTTLLRPAGMEVGMAPDTLTHDLDGDSFTCQSCADDGDDNAHTDSNGAGKVDVARVDVAEATDVELICWCGHSLHYADCPDKGACHLISNIPSYGYCARRYRGAAGIIAAVLAENAAPAAEDILRALTAAGYVVMTDDLGSGCATNANGHHRAAFDLCADCLEYAQ